MSRIVVIGASNNDVILKSHDAIVPGDSNPGISYETDGGVGRNITENLIRLGLEVTFLTILGNDASGDRIQRNLENLGVKVIANKIGQTPSYTAIMDANGELVVAINHMNGINALDGDFIKMHQKTILGADVLVIEANLSDDALTTICQMVGGRVPIYADGISAAKVRKLIPLLHHFECLKVNLLEAAALTGLSVQEGRETLCHALMALGPNRVLLSLGQAGAMECGFGKTYFRKPLETVINNTSGAGDALFSGFIFGTVENKDPLLCGLLCARASLQSDDPVNKNLNPDRFRQMIKDGNL